LACEMLTNASVRLTTLGVKDRAVSVLAPRDEETRDLVAHRSHSSCFFLNLYFPHLSFLVLSLHFIFCSSLCNIRSRNRKKFPFSYYFFEGGSSTCWFLNCTSVINILILLILSITTMGSQDANPSMEHGSKKRILVARCHKFCNRLIPSAFLGD